MAERRLDAWERIYETRAYLAHGQTRARPDGIVIDLLTFDGKTEKYLKSRQQMLTSPFLFGKRLRARQQPLTKWQAKRQKMAKKSQASLEPHSKKLKISKKGTQLLTVPVQHTRLQLNQGQLNLKEKLQELSFL